MTEYIVRIPPDMPYEIRAELNAWYVESEPIVRCRDCKHFVPKGAYKFENGIVNDDFCRYMRSYLLLINPDGFCAWGERKEVDEQSGEMFKKHISQVQNLVKSGQLDLWKMVVE